MLVDVQEGAIFAGRYRVTRLLASGAMGAVYEVVHLETERRRALKVMHAHVLGRAGMRERFKLEARIAANVESEHIVEVFDAGVDEATGRPFLVMELLRGEDLGQRLERVGRFPIGEALAYLRQTALALEGTHRARIVHRDLKPSNLFRAEREDGSARIKVLDFGVAKLLAESASDDATRMAGTPVYMAPEQMRGEPVTPAADVHALGMIAFALLAGEAYWAAARREAPDFVAFALLAARGPDEPASVRASRRGASLPPGFDAWFARATAADPAARFESAVDAVRALDEIVGPEEASFQAPNETIGEPGRPMPDRSTVATGPVQGKSLREYAGDAEVPIALRIGWISAAARAIAAAQRGGITCAEIEAADVIVRADGKVVLREGALDRPGEGGPPSAMTLTDDERGAPSLALAPEQIRGEPADERTAQFAWGIVAYELLAGAPPWSAEAPGALLARVLHDAPESLRAARPEVPEAVERVVMRALAKRRDDRHASLDEVADRLDAALDDASSMRDEVGGGGLFAGRFAIEREAGAGGMGAVYRAIDRRTGRPVALKVLHEHRAPQGERFAREAEVLAELRHPAIVRYVAHGTTERGRLFLAMEWVEGETLAARLDRGRLAVAEALALGKRLAGALAAAHRRGLVHRDVKPGNVLLPGGDAGEAKLADFGIVRLASVQRRTRTGEMLGTPGYMAPEQARGEGDVDARADVFALGCVLFEALTGRATFEGDDWMTVLLKVVLEDAPRVSELAPEVPPALCDLVAAMLSKARDARPEGGRAVAEAIEGIALHAGDAIAEAAGAPVLTATERRVMCLLIARPPRGEEAALGALREAAAPHGARLDVLADGSVLAVLAAHEGDGAAVDLALRAARCALAVRAALPRGSMALVTGRGELEDRRGTSALVDRGVRLLAGEIDAGVRLDEATAGLVGARFDVRGDGRGLALHGERDAAVARRTLLGKDTPCVGRDREIAVLEGMLDECAAERVAQAALVIGPPGIGKSRLLDELLRRARARRPGLEIWFARGDPMSAGSPFGIVGQALRRAAGVLEGEPVEAQRGKLRARIGRHVRGAALARVAAFAGEIAGVPIAPEGSAELAAALESAILMGDQVRRAFGDLLEAECSAAPLLLVLEDLHWGDRPSIDLVDAALRNLEGLPLLVLALARPEVHALYAELWPERRVQTLRLGELTRRQSEQIVRAGLGEDAGAETIAGIVERAGGNAFFLEELVRAAAEGHDELPETVLAVVESRLARLPPEARRALRAASVLGRTFFRGALLALLGGGAAADLASLLDDLARREIVVRRAEARFPGEEEYAFRHALVRDAAYAMLTDDDRALGHRLAGDWLEAAGERDAALLAEHFERGGDAARALGWYRRAAEQALGGNDLDEVVLRADRGIACGAAGPMLGELRYLQAEAYNWRSRYAEAVAHVRDAIASLPPAHGLFAAALGVGALASFQRGDVDGLVDFSTRILAAPPGEETSSAWIVAATRASVCLFFAGKLDLAGAMLARVEAAERSGAVHDPYALAAIHRVYGTRAKHHGESGLAHFMASADYAERAGNLRQAFTVRVNIGFSLMLLGAYEQAERELRVGLAGNERLGVRNVAATALQNLGLVRALRGDRAEGRAIEEQALRAFEAQGDARNVGVCRIYLAIIAAGAGDLAAAEREAQAAAEGLSVAPPMRAYALAVLADVRLAAGRAADATGPANEAAALLDALGGIEEGEALIRLVDAAALEAAGRAGEARAVLRAARERLLERAARISDEALRRSFLEAVPDHARTLALAAAVR